jgi:hypothetical protein
VTAVSSSRARLLSPDWKRQYAASLVRRCSASGEPSGVSRAARWYSSAGAPRASARRAASSRVCATRSSGPSQASARWRARSSGSRTRPARPTTRLKPPLTVVAGSRSCHEQTHLGSRLHSRDLRQRAPRWPSASSRVPDLWTSRTDPPLPDSSTSSTIDPCPRSSSLSGHAPSRPLCARTIIVSQAVSPGESHLPRERSDRPEDPVCERLAPRSVLRAGGRDTSFSLWLPRERGRNTAGARRRSAG